MKALGIAGRLTPSGAKINQISAATGHDRTNSVSIPNERRLHVRLPKAVHYVS
jgi:hypothetical protein